MRRKMMRKMPTSPKGLAAMDIIETFKDRTKHEVKVFPGPAGCTTMLGNKPIDVMVPPDESEKGRVIRLHESLHCLEPELGRGLGGVSESARQAAPDVYLHLNHVSGINAVQDELGRVAVEEVKSLPDNWADPALIQTAGIMAARALAIGYGLYYKGRPEFIHAICKQLNKRIGVELTQTLASAVLNMRSEYARGKDKQEVLQDFASQFDRLFRGFEEKTGGGGAYDRELQGMEAGGEEEGEDDGNRRGIPSGEIGNDEGGDSPEMEIVNLPLTESHISKVPGERAAEAGWKIRAGKLVSAAINPQPGRIFRKKLRHKGGTFLFDASGSMDWSMATLKTCVKQCPAAKVAYYAADDSESGTLAIAAAGGKMAGKLPEYGEGNVVDENALQWLMKQPGPRYFVSDGGFDSGSSGDRATALATIGEKRGWFKWYRSKEEFMKDFRVNEADIIEDGEEEDDM